MAIRADAGARIGTGHVMRCLALAQAWRSAGGRAVFIMAADAPVIESRLQSEGFMVEHISAEPGGAEDARKTCDIAGLNGADIIVVDGYHFNSEYQALIKASGKCLLFVDDYGHADRYFADLVLNQNIYADEGLYWAREPYTRLLLGSPFVLLRREFWPWRGWGRTVLPKACRVLITLGGSDPDNVTLKVIESLHSLVAEGLEAVAVVGGSNCHCDEIRLACESSPIHLRLVQNASNMPELMAWADVAISSAGTTSWELAFMGLPSLSIVLADNQVRVAEKLSEAGVSTNLGWHDRLSAEALGDALAALLCDPLRRSSMAVAGRQMVDGLGPLRVVSSILEMLIPLRAACRDDCGLIFRWANDPDCRAASFSTGLIPWEEHVRWFEGKLADPDCTLFIALDQKSSPMGQVRFEVKGKVAVISVSIDPCIRGQGMGSLMVLRAAEEIFKRRPISLVNAFIKPENQRSIRAFEKAGFTLAGQEVVKGCQALRYIKERID